MARIAATWEKPLERVLGDWVLPHGGRTGEGFKETTWQDTVGWACLKKDGLPQSRGTQALGR